MPNTSSSWNKTIIIIIMIIITCIFIPQATRPLAMFKCIIKENEGFAGLLILLPGRLGKDRAKHLLKST